METPEGMLVLYGIYRHMDLSYTCPHHPVPVSEVCKKTVTNENKAKVINYAVFPE